MGLLNIIRNLFVGHRCYWGIPIKRDRDNRMIQICYGCNREREVKAELVPSAMAERAEVAE